MKIWKPSKKLVQTLRAFYNHYNHADYDDVWYIIHYLYHLQDMNPVDYLTWKDIQTIYGACQNVEVGDEFNEKRYFSQVLKLLKEDAEFKLKRTSW